MNSLFWQGQPLSLSIEQADDTDWVSLPDLVAVIDGHLQDLPGGVGLCLADDRCLPLRGDDLRQQNGQQQVRVTALAPLGIVSDQASAPSQILLGDPLPDLTMPTLAGDLVAFKSLIGKPTLLFAWASW